MSTQEEHRQAFEQAIGVILEGYTRLSVTAAGNDERLRVALEVWRQTKPVVFGSRPFVPQYQAGHDWEEERKRVTDAMLAAAQGPPKPVLGG